MQARQGEGNNCWMEGNGNVPHLTPDVPGGPPPRCTIQYTTSLLDLSTDDGQVSNLERGPWALNIGMIYYSSIFYLSLETTIQLRALKYLK